MEWINVKDKLPEITEVYQHVKQSLECLVLFDGYQIGIAYYCIDTEDFAKLVAKEEGTSIEEEIKKLKPYWYLYNDGGLVTGITHWMLFPKNPMGLIYQTY